MGNKTQALPSQLLSKQVACGIKAPSHFFASPLLIAIFAMWESSIGEDGQDGIGQQPAG